MPGVTGYPDISNASPMNGPAQIKEQSDHWDDIEDRSYATSSAFPAAASTYPGRLVFAQDTGLLYINGGSAWIPVTDWVDITSTLTLGSIFTGAFSAGGDFAVYRLGKMVMLNLNVHKTSNYGAGDQFMVLPASIRPAKSTRGAAVFFGAAWGMCGIEIQAAGPARVLQVFASVTSDIHGSFVYRTT
jgi:hypothetical protein